MQINGLFESILAGTGLGGAGLLLWKKLFNHTSKTGAETDIINQQSEAIAHLTARVDELFKINVGLQNSYLQQERECRARDNALQDKIRALKLKVEELEKLKLTIKK